MPRRVKKKTKARVSTPPTVSCKGPQQIMSSWTNLQIESEKKKLIFLIFTSPAIQPANFSVRPCLQIFWAMLCLAVPKFCRHYPGSPTATQELLDKGQT